MKTNIFFPFALFMLCYSAINAQNQYESSNVDVFNNGSAETASSAKENMYSVHYATGIPSISYPVYTISQNGFSLPISLSYNASGLKVDEVASRVGLGWSLNAGGSLIRVVKGIPDYDPLTGYSKYISAAANLTYNVNGGPSDQYCLNNIYSGVWDGEPDLFLFSFAGRSGKFYVNPDGNMAHTIPFQDLQINNEIYDPSTTPCWRIIDESGNKFFFCDKERSTIMGNNVEVLSTEKITSFYLTKIVLIDGSTIEFEYIYKTYTQPMGIRETKIDRLVGASASPCDLQESIGNGATQVLTTQMASIITTPRLSKITFQTGSVEFEYNTTPREDQADDNALIAIKLLDKKANLVKKTILEQNYTPPYVFGDKGRLRLKKLIDFDKDGNSLLPTVFDYNAVPFPPVGSFSKDNWGYFNNSSASTSLPIYPASSSNYVIGGADRSFNPYYAQAGILTGINYSNGSSVTFEYERNSYVDAYDNTEKAGPGLRIKKIQRNDGTGKLSFTSYRYQTAANVSSGKLNYKVEDFNTPFTRPVTISMLNPVNHFYETSIHLCPCILRRADPFVRAPYMIGNPVNYTRVEAIEHSLSGNIDASKLGSTIYEYNQDYVSTASGVMHIKAYKNGIPTKITSLNKEGHIVSLISYDYAEPQLENSIFGVVPILVGLDPSGNNFYSHNKYKLYAAWMPIEQVTKRVYEVNSTTNYTEEVTAFTYGTTQHTVPIEITTTVNGITKATKQKFPLDYSPAVLADDQSRAVKYMQDNHVLTPVIESVTFQQGLVVGGIVTVYKPLSIGYGLSKEYKLKNVLPYPVSGHSFASFTGAGNFVFSPNYKLQKEVNAYNASGDPIQLSERNRVTSLIINPVIDKTLAIVQNANQLDIAYCGFEEYEQVASPVNIHPSSNFFITGSGNCTAAALFATPFAGKKSLTIGGTCGVKLSCLNRLDKAKTYRLTFWALGAFPSLRTINGNNIAAVLSNPNIRQEANGWTLYEYILTNVQTFDFNAENAISIDEVKLTPIEAEISNVVFDPFIGITSQSDVNNNYTHSSYDGFGRVKKVTDVNRNILQLIEHVQQEQQ